MTSRKDKQNRFPNALSTALVSTALVVAIYHISSSNNKAQSNHPRQLATLSSYADPKHVTPHVHNPITNSIISTHEWPWPTDEMPDTPEGTYISNITPHRLSTQTTTGNTGRVVLYVTSHMSQQHEMFLKYCWPNILARSALLQEADVVVYLNPEEEKRKEAMDLLKITFADHNLKVYLRENQGYNDGAKIAMYEAVTLKFFAGYDWVIRLNPDVIIRDDSFLIESMANPSVSALLINCSNRGAKVHTDFFVINPDMLNAEAFIWKGNAERSFTTSIDKSILQKGSHRWIPNTAPATSECRAGLGRDFYKSPIVHAHVLHPEFCSVPSDIDVSAVFP